MQRLLLAVLARALVARDRRTRSLPRVGYFSSSEVGGQNDFCWRRLRTETASLKLALSLSCPCPLHREESQHEVQPGDPSHYRPHIRGHRRYSMCPDRAALRHNKSEDADVPQPVQGIHRLLPEDLLSSWLLGLLQGNQSGTDGLRG